MNKKTCVLNDFVTYMSWHFNYKRQKTSYICNNKFRKKI